MAAINRTGTQPVDFSRVTFARERGGGERNNIDFHNAIRLGYWFAPSLSLPLPSPPLDWAPPAVNLGYVYYPFLTLLDGLRAGGRAARARMPRHARTVLSLSITYCTCMFRVLFTFQQQKYSPSSEDRRNVLLKIRLFILYLGIIIPSE